jgi:hypothetical protein
MAFVRQELTHWQQDSDLTSVRRQQALEKLAEDEREAWSLLWKDVASLVETVQEK